MASKSFNQLDKERQISRYLSVSIFMGLIGTLFLAFVKAQPGFFSIAFECVTLFMAIKSYLEVWGRLPRAGWGQKEGQSYWGDCEEEGLGQGGGEEKERWAGVEEDVKLLREYRKKKPVPEIPLQKMHINTNSALERSKKNFQPGMDPHKLLADNILTQIAFLKASQSVYCFKCKQTRMPRAHHCSKLGYCVERMDHYCTTASNTIGAGNHRFFMQLLIWGWISVFYAICLVIDRLWKDLVVKESHLFVSLMLPIECVVFLMLTILLIWQISQISQNQTSIEELIESDELRKKFDRGTAFKNFVDFYEGDLTIKNILLPF